jgi:hypothetical protein
MNNEQYLIASYFVIGLTCAGLGFATFALLRGSFRTLTNTISAGHLGLVFRRWFLVGILLPSLAGFFSVTYRNCSKDSYQKIIADRSYLVAKNQEQLRASVSSIAVALLVWGGILSLGFWAANGREKTSG